ncbi:MAG TPA: NapC/NirT family cytochrome c [Gemmatimonadales bacterium]
MFGRVKSLLQRRSRLVRLAVQLGVLAVIVGAVGTVGFVEYSANPKFCLNCHLMEPYYESWASSSHRDVPCIKCHYAPGVRAEAMGKLQAANQVVKYVTGTYGMKPWAEIEDAACLRSGCHVEARLEGEVEYRGVSFNHAHHLGELRRGKQLRCTSCHSQIVQGDHVAVTAATCFLCHFKGRLTDEPIAGCVGCHTAPPVTHAADGSLIDHPRYVEEMVSCRSCHDQVTHGTGEAEEPRCFNCHNEPERVAQIENTTLVHRIHIADRNVECTQCHTPIEHHVISRRTTPMALDCASCHQEVHDAQRNLLAGVGGHGVEETPASMYLARVSCASCHQQVRQAAAHERVNIANEASCLSCHGTKYAKILPAWQAEMARRSSEVEAALRDVTAARRTGTGRLDVVVDSLIRLARENIELVRVGRGPHNVAYADALLRAAHRFLLDAVRVGQLNVTVPRGEMGPPIRSNQCLQCHLGVERQEGQFQGRRFPHDRHVLQMGLSCATCHTPYEAHGGITIGALQCAQCHHQDAKAGTCGACHEGDGGAPVATFDLPQGKFSHEPHVGIGLPCQSCHQADPSMATAPVNCDNCHAPHHQPTTTCLSCHQGGAKAKHAVSFAHSDCRACHGTKVEGVTEWSRNVCTVCHTDRVEHNAPAACHLCHQVKPLRAPSG